MNRFVVLAVALALTALPPARAETLVQFRTLFGDIDVACYDRDKPITVQNFKRYIEQGLYADTIFHRGTVPPQVQVIQGGFLRVNNQASITNFTLSVIPSYAPITNEIGCGTFRSNTYGTIAMAKTSDPNSATSQFYFNLVDNSTALDNTNNAGGFTVFGHVVGGTNVLNRLNAAHSTAGIIIVNAGSSLAELPLLSTAQPPSIDSDELVFVDITLLRVEVTAAGNTRHISWDSIAGRSNIVEYTSSMPPEWTPLVATNGDGTRLTVSDTTATNRFRFYRVRVLY